MKYGHCFPKPRLAPFIMKQNFLWFPFYLITVSFFQDMFSSPLKVKLVILSWLLLLVRGGDGSRAKDLGELSLTQCCWGPAHMRLQGQSSTTSSFVHEHTSSKTLKMVPATLGFKESSSVYFFLMLSLTYQTIYKWTAKERKELYNVNFQLPWQVSAFWPSHLFIKTCLPALHHVAS